MAFWRRINQSKLQFISNQCRRFYFQAPYYSSSLDQTRTCILERSVSCVDRKPSYFYSNVRYFAAPVQAKKNVKEEVSDGPRLNEQITAKIVRLVTDAGHDVVYIDEALERAKKLGLDLVEVQRTGNPPVCKLMDFYQERFKHRVREKDRAKSKSRETLKKGDCKEIRFTEKIEAKDLKLKAETAIRLMERGYRVKCTAMGKGKEDEDENLGGLLSRLTDLIKDVAFVESAPRVERKQAIVIVRHVKFGPSKKTGGKSSKVVGDTKAEHPAKSGAEGQDPMVPGDDSIESISESENEILVDEDDLPTSLPMRMHHKIAKDKNVSSHSTGYSHLGTSLGIDNRYKKSELRNQFPPDRSMDGADQITREQVRSEPRFPYQRQQPPQNVNAYQRQQPPQNVNAYQEQQPPQNMNAYQQQQQHQNMNSYSVGETKQVRNDASLPRNSRPSGTDFHKQQPSHSDVPEKPAASFGIFSMSKADSSGKQGVATNAHGSSQGNGFASVGNRGMEGDGASPNSQSDGSQRPNQNVDTGAKDRFGIFGRDSSNTTQNRMPNSN